MENKTNILSDRIFTKPANNTIHMPIDFGVLKTSDKENKIAHWYLEDGDLDEVHCSSCGYATRDVVFLREDDGKISTIYPKKCKQCGAEMTHLNIIGEQVEKALKHHIEDNNGRFSLLTDK